VFRYQIQVRRTPLPRLLAEVLTDGLGAERLWTPLSDLLARDGASLPDSWQTAVRNLPPPLDRLLAPVGPLLCAGGEPLARAVEETREELTSFLREETARQASRSRVTAALCLGGASLLILVLL